MNLCPFDAAGSIGPMISMPQATKGQNGHCIQLRWRRMDQVSVYLALMTLAHKADAISFHGEPVIPCSKNFLCHNIPTHMWPANSGMYFGHDSRGLLSIYAPQQPKIWSSFVQIPLLKKNRLAKCRIVLF